MTIDDGRPEAPLTMTYTAAPRADGPGDLDPLETTAPAPGASRNKVIAIGVGGAVALGVLLGVVMGPSFKTAKPEPTLAKVPASDGQLQIEVTTRQAPAPKVAMNAGKIDAAGTVIQPTPATFPAPAPQPVRERKEHKGILGSIAGIFGIGGNDDERNSDDRQQARPAPAPAPRIVRSDPQVQPQPQPQPRADQVVVLERADPRDLEPAAYRDEPVAAPRRVYARPSFDCRYARSRAEQMVCGDPRLAAYDRRLASAFRRAVDNGASYRQLRAQQDRWLAARERAAVSPAAVGMVYEQRIAELEDIGAQAREQDDGDGW